MKRKVVALVLGALFTLPAFAAQNARQPMSLLQAIAHVQSQFPGEVIAANYDASGREAGHYHVDLRLPHGPVVKLEVDALAGTFANVTGTPQGMPDSRALNRAVERLVRLFPGSRVKFAEFDATNPADPHYHFDVILEGGETMPVRLDARAGDLAWRDIVADRS